MSFKCLRKHTHTHRCLHCNKADRKQLQSRQHSATPQHIFRSGMSNSPKGPHRSKTEDKRKEIPRHLGNLAM